jgi:predicted dehydrogenase
MKSISRRTFLATAGAATAATLQPGFAIGQEGESANAKINIAFIGAGGMARAGTRACAQENYVAFCDVDDARASETYNQYPNVPRFNDFRKMLDKMENQIDAVVISTPDHTHFAAAMECMQRGKHVYVQKPLAHNIWQVRTLQKAARKYGVITQMGNQGHASDGIREAKEWVQAGVLGKVREAHVWTDRPKLPWFKKPVSIPPKADAVPDTLDWDLWQGPTAARSFSREYVPVKWRGWWDYGCGSLGDIGCHELDTPIWTMDLGLPEKVKVKLNDDVNKDFTPFSAVVTYHFPAEGDRPATKVHWYEGAEAPRPKGMREKEELVANGSYMVGSKETLYMPYMHPNKPKLVPPNRERDLRGELPAPTIPRVAQGPFHEWMRAIKGTGPMPGSNFEVSAKLTEVVLLGALAIRTGHNIKWDAENMQAKGHPELASYIKEEVQPGWEYGEDLWKS